MHEKFVMIWGKKKKLITVSNGDGAILAHRLSRNRNSNTIRKVVKKVIKINGKNPKVIATDGFSSYTKVIRNLPFDVIHVR
ncbi:MAG: DDE-type integrase/transposase/recombinase [Candidatus Helarchaeota archaeon]